MATSIVETITGAFSSFVSGIGTTIVNAFDSIFLNSEGGLSNLAIWGLVFAGVGLGMAIIRKFTSKA